MATARWPRKIFLSVEAARTALTSNLPASLDYLVACSGGADSLALAATMAWARRHGALTGELGAVVVDHGMQPGSAAAAAQAGRECERLGFSTVAVITLDVAGGNEADARAARYAALEAERVRTGADFVLTAHTADDQAEQVLLGLARGSGTRSIAGIPTRGPRLLRPFLDLRREDTEAVCQAASLTPWEDPTNALPVHLRNRVRHEVLPLLREVLGAGIDDALVRTARLARQDAELLDELAAEALAVAVLEDEPAVLGDAADRVGGRAPTVWELDRLVVRDAPAALRSRMLRLAAVAVGGRPPTAERTAALERLADGEGSAGPVQLDGHVSVTRERLEEDRSVLRFRGLG